MKEKSQQEKNAAERQVELLSEALDKAVDNKGYWLNIAGNAAPGFYDKGVTISPFNALVLALNTDRNGYKTNLYTLYNDARNRGESVREHERGVPFNWYNWDKYIHKQNPDDIISRKEYTELSTIDRMPYKGVQNREIRTLFNIDQTLLPTTDKEKYDALLKKYGHERGKGKGENDAMKLRIVVNDFMLKVRDNLVPIQLVGNGVAHYDKQKDVVSLPREEDFEHYQAYAQEMLRQVVGATGHQQRLSRAGMTTKSGLAPLEDAIKQERLIVELASGVKMMELGLPARLSNESLRMVDFWNRELKENPSLVDAVERDVNNALEMIRKAERGERVGYTSIRNQQQENEKQADMPKHYYVAEEIGKHPDKESKMVVVVKDEGNKTADVILPAGASLEVNNEAPGMSKSRIRHTLEKEGFETVRFYNPDGALGYRPDDSYFENKSVTVARLKNWVLEDISRLDVSQAVQQSGEVGFDRIQMIRDDDGRWAMYIKPEGKEAFAVYPERSDLTRFFSTLKQAPDKVDGLRLELARKYDARVAMQPDLKVDLFGFHTQNIDWNRIQKVNVLKTKEGAILCSATIEGVDDLEARVVSPSQWQRMWLAEDRNEYKVRLAATLFADILRKGQAEDYAGEKQEKEAGNSISERYSEGIQQEREGQQEMEHSEEEQLGRIKR